MFKMHQYFSPACRLMFNTFDVKHLTGTISSVEFIRRRRLCRSKTVILANDTVTQFSSTRPISW